MTRRIEVEVYEVECARCDTRFRSPMKGPWDVRVVRNFSGEVRGIDLDDPVLDEVTALASRSPAAEGRKRIEIDRAAIAAWPGVFDRDADGSEFDQQNLQPCPACGFRQIAQMYRMGGDFVELEVEMLTHAAWDELSPEDRQALVTERMWDYYSA